MFFYFVLLGLIAICFFSLAAGSLESFSRHKLEEYCRRRNGEERFAQILKHHERVAAVAGMSQILCTVLLLSFIFIRYDTFFQNDLYSRFATVIGIVFVFLLAEFWLPRAVSRLWGTYFAYYTWLPLRGIAALLYPLSLFDRFVNLFFHRLAGEAVETDEEDAFEEEIRTMVTEGHREGLLEEDAREMIEGVMELRDVTVSEVMTPRTDMKSISNDLTWDEMLQAVMEVSHSRIPVHRETRDDIIGVLHLKNLFRELALTDPSQRHPWTELLSEPLFVPETKPVDALLQEFQNTKPTGDGDDRARGHLAIVLDEYGGVAGIVTLEDILEEIVGEITDEHETVKETEEITELNDGTFEVLGRVRIDEINSKLDLNLPDEEDYDTVAGFIFSTLGHIPEAGEWVDFEYEGKTVRLTVIEATRRRIEKVRVERNHTLP